MAIVGRAKYTHAGARNFEATRREGSVASKFRARACVCISPAPQSPSPKLETTRSLCNQTRAASRAGGENRGRIETLTVGD